MKRLRELLGLQRIHAIDNPRTGRHALQRINDTAKGNATVARKLALLHRRNIDALEARFKKNPQFALRYAKSRLNTPSEL